MAEQVVRLSFPAKPDYLLLARLVLAGLTRDVPVDDEGLADLKLAVTEACGNAVRHAYPGIDSGEVAISYRLTDGVFEVIVEDQGVGIGASTDISAADAHGVPLESGMGMAIIRTVVDELDVSVGADGRGTVVRMTKQLVPIGA